jgi:formate hydrogenlyase subunit 5
MTEFTRPADASAQRRSVPARIAQWAPQAVAFMRGEIRLTVIACAPDELKSVCRRLTSDFGYSFATLVVEEARAEWRLAYLFWADVESGLVQVEVSASGAQPGIPSISVPVHAADWHEREAEDLFGLVFEGHPRLGDFVLHAHRPQGSNPMRSGFHDAGGLPQEEIRPWRPDRIVHAPGAFMMPIGPVYSDFAESARFLLETVGEDVIRIIPRFFYKYRGVEKRAQGRTVEDVLLLAERFSGTSAIAHSLAFCQAVEAICGAPVPPRARALRGFLAELERCRHHVGVISDICGSTGLAVATSQAAILEEELLRLCCQSTGHRYLFGLNAPGGLTRDMQDGACRSLAQEVQGIVERLTELGEMLRFSSSFLDRIEEVGAVSKDKVMDYGLVGPIARASGCVRDLRIVLPYACYGKDWISCTAPCEQEGDGYARLRIFMAEAVQSARMMRQIAGSLPPGAVRCPAFNMRAGAALGWSEAPRGAAFHWVRIGDDGRVARYRVTPPSFVNWHGFHLAAENFAFQDFPIIMATFGLSNAECDR